jgi:uncharacterized protein (DUF433 family)
VSSPVDIGSLIESRQDRRGGRPYITGTGVSVDRVAILFGGGVAPAGIAERFELSLPQVYAAVACYLANREAMDEDIARQDAEAQRVAERWHAKPAG